MLKYARNRGLNVLKGVAEDLPYGDKTFDYAVFITAMCFINDPGKAVEEAHRILKGQGKIIIAFIEKESRFGKFLEKEKKKSRFYKYAHFFSVHEIVSLLEENRFMIEKIIQTLEDPANPLNEEPSEGHGRGSFVVIRGVKI